MTKITGTPSTRPKSIQLPINLTFDIELRKSAPDEDDGTPQSPFFHLAEAAVRAISDRSVGERALARALPPLARFWPLLGTSSISPVAIRMTWTALPITSAGGFSPFGPRGIPTNIPHGLIIGL